MYDDALFQLCVPPSKGHQNVWSNNYSYYLGTSVSWDYIICSDELRLNVKSYEWEI